MTSLRTRLMLVYIGLIVLGFGGLTLLAGRQIANSAYTEFANNLEVNGVIVASSLVEYLEDGRDGVRDNVDLVANLRVVGAQLSAEITLTDQHGNPLLSTTRPLPASKLNIAPEIVALQNGQTQYDIRANADGERTIYTVSPILYEGDTLGFLQLAAPASIPETTVRQSWLAMGTGFVVFALAGLAISLWLLASLTRPLTDLRTTALEMASGDLTQRVAISQQDEIGAVGEAFNQMAEQVEAMVAEQQAFASNASHELRTPLTTIRLRTEYLQSAETLSSPTAHQYIDEIDSEAHRLSNLVADLILLSRIDAHRLAIGDEHVDAVRLAHALQRDLQPLAESKGLSFTLTVAEDSLPVQANLNHLRVVWRNVLDNAVKFTPAGGMVAWCVVRDGKAVLMQVVDDGVGVSAENLPQLGKRFFRTDKSRSRRTKGVGLGLSLVRSIVELYGGDVQITSDGINQGTTVNIWWPLVQT